MGSYEAPLRCDRCGIVIHKKPKAKTPKFCSACRERQQTLWKENQKTDRQRRVRGR